MPQEILNNNEDLTQNEWVDKKDIEALNVLHDANPEEIKEITDDIETWIKKSPDLKAAIESGYENIIVENEKTVNNKVDENAWVEKTSNELETVETESKNSQVGEISVPVSINEIKVGDIVYSSIDNYNPKIEWDKNKKDELLAEVQKLRDSWSQLTHLW